MMGSQRKGGQSASRLAFAVHVGMVALLAAQMPVQAANKISSAVQQEFIAFHIPAQPLDKAVLIFAEQAGLQVLFDSQMLRGLNLVALNGDLGVQGKVWRACWATTRWSIALPASARSP